jgi:hypothetical protein
MSGNQPSFIKADVPFFSLRFFDVLHRKACALVPPAIERFRIYWADVERMKLDKNLGNSLEVFCIK